MADGERTDLLKSINTSVAGLKDAILGLKKGDDVSELQKTLEKIEGKVEEYETQEELVKTLEGEKSDLTKKLGESEDKVKELQKTVDEVNKTAIATAHTQLVEKALDLAKTLDADTEIKDEDSYMAVLSKSFSEEDIEKDVDACIKTDIKAMEIAKTLTPAGDVPGNGGNDEDEELDADAQRAKELRKKLKEEGFLKGDD